MKSPYKQIPSDAPNADHQDTIREIHPTTKDIEDQQDGGVKLVSSPNEVVKYADSAEDENNHILLTSKVLRTPVKERADAGVIDMQHIHYNQDVTGDTHQIDYDSDEEEDLGRYSAVYNHNLVGNRNSTCSDTKRSLPNSPQHCWTRSSKTIMRPAKRLFRTIRDVRVETRRKRMEKMLAMREDETLRFHKERCELCLGSWCDLLDKGCVPILLVLAAYVVVLVILNEEQALVRNIMLGVGIPLFIFRISWRPISWFVFGRRAERVRDPLVHFLVTI